MKHPIYLIFATCLLLAGIISTSVLFSGCNPSKSKTDFAVSGLELAKTQLDAAVIHTPDTFRNFGPRTIVNEKVSYITNVRRL